MTDIKMIVLKGVTSNKLGAFFNNIEVKIYRERRDALKFCKSYFVPSY